MGVYLIADGSYLDFYWNIVKVAFGLGLVIFVHELGHFLIAKWNGVKCEKFYLGFDIPMPWGIPSKLLKFQWGETEYGIGILPLGGYVKMLGQDDNPGNAEKERERSLVSADASAAPAPTSPAPAAATASAPAFDPRSYQAKKVWQRMAIISAGVIFNLIFAVIFAAIAYKMGARFTPAVVGGATPAGAIWTQNWEPGSRVVQIGRDSYRNDHMRFDKDLAPRVVLSGVGEPLDMLLVTPSGEEKWVSVTPELNPPLMGDKATLGFEPSSSLKLSNKPTFAHLPAGAKADQFQEHDRIVAIDGEALKTPNDLFAAQFSRVDREITFTLERKADEKSEATTRHDVKVGVNAMRWLGFAVGLGEIVAVRPKSPAEQAGFKKGDVLKSVNGDSNLDPVTLAQLVYRRIGQATEVEVERAGASATPERVKLTVTPTAPVIAEKSGRPTDLESLESLGIAYRVSSTLARVEPNGPAEKAGLRVGDEITKVTFVPANAERNKQESEFSRSLEIEMGPTLDWTSVHNRMQMCLDDTRVSITYNREGKSDVANDMSPVPYEGRFNPERGIAITMNSEIRTADTWNEAFSLGFRETREAMWQVVSVLRALIFGRLSPTNLGGIGTIAAQAAYEASDGIATLLIFLTLLSANLAVINFLPIPVLDGGHFVFLAYEGLMRKPANERVQIALTYSGLAFVLMLLVFTISLDVARFSGLMKH